MLGGSLQFTVRSYQKMWWSSRLKSRVGIAHKEMLGTIAHTLLLSLLLGTISINAIAPTLAAERSRPRTAEEVEEIDPDEEFISPLDFTELEPLLPDSWPEVPLNAAQKSELEQEILNLDAIAAQEWLAENPEDAFELWYRALRLRQALDRVTEVQALGRIGALAWESDRPQDVQYISQRLETIQGSTLDRDLDLTAALATASAQVRLYANAVELYETLLADAEVQGDIATEERVLLVLAELHRTWFKFEEAIAVNQQLLAIANQQFDDAMVQTHLETLVYLYEQTEQWTAAIDHQEKLFAAYLKKSATLKLAPLRLAVARNFDRLDQGETASQFYQDAFELAWPNRQYAYAGDALIELAELYVRYDQPDIAIALYQEQLKAAEYAYDRYHRLTTWDRLGQLYLAAQRYGDAITAFEQGFAIAISIGHREAYFEEQLQAARAAQFGEN